MTINDGMSFNQGTIGNMVWQASGVLETAGCGLSTISDCYQMSLTSDAAAQLDTNHLGSPRQRDEFHFPQVTAGTEFNYMWKQYMYSSTGTGSTWFHIMQAFGVAENGPLVTLDAVRSTLRIKDYVRGTGGTSCGRTTCPSANISDYYETTVTHTISGMFGPSGRLSYNITNEAEGTTILSYAVNGAMGEGNGYVKFGMYRLTFEGMTSAKRAYHRITEKCTDRVRLELSLEIGPVHDTADSGVVPYIFGGNE
ncbi:hypothetical protein B0H11DRAFT_1748797 [Mycena galericulata]|nr:hypothetical protein B0H11DRAFT_1748797 [Mycena galericulata]